MATNQEQKKLQQWTEKDRKFYEEFLDGLKDEGPNQLPLQNNSFNKKQLEEEAWQSFQIKLKEIKKRLLISRNGS